MAKIVTAFGTPHTPFLPEQVSNAPGQLKPEAMMNEVREHLKKPNPTSSSCSPQTTSLTSSTTTSRPFALG